MIPATVNHLSGFRTHGRHYNGTYGGWQCHKELRRGTKPGSYRFGCMEYRGVKYMITQGTQQPEVWRWRTVVGDPAVLRMGEESSPLQAELMVRRLIDWSLSQAERSKPDV